MFARLCSYILKEKYWKTIFKQILKKIVQIDISDNFDYIKYLKLINRNNSILREKSKLKAKLYLIVLKTKI